MLEGGVHDFGHIQTWQSGFEFTWRGVYTGVYMAALTRIPITDELLEWPADLFALTNVILERS